MTKLPENSAPAQASDTVAGRPQRADAQRNRMRVLEVAAAAFTAEGLGVSVHEIARRAGVGTGTVSRHFPTKESLFEAIILDRIAKCVTVARTLAETLDPGEAFFAYIAFLIDKGASDQALAEVMVGGGYDIEAAASRSQHDMLGALRQLLDAAQRSGAVRADLDTADVKAVVAGCLSRERNRPDPAARNRMIAIACAGLRAAAT
jgi:AcrR family transcriptional regulator